MTSAGKMTWVGPMLASPGRGETVKRIGGLKLRSVERLPLPRLAIEKRGLKPRRAHSPTWKRLARVADFPPVAPTSAVKAIGSQLVGLSVKFDRSMITLRSRIATGMPSMIVGIGSLLTVICAVL